MLFIVVGRKSTGFYSIWNDITNASVVVHLSSTVVHNLFFTFKSIFPRKCNNPVGFKIFLPPLIYQQNYRFVSNKSDSEPNPKFALPSLPEFWIAIIKKQYPIVTNDAIFGLWFLLLLLAYVRRVFCHGSNRDQWKSQKGNENCGLNSYHDSIIIVLCNKNQSTNLIN